MKDKSFSFIGLGLIGGSIAKALRKAYPDCLIRAYDLHQSSLELALKEQTINKICTLDTEQLYQCDFLFLCAPVLQNDSLLPTIKKRIRPDTIVTDVGSVKQTTHQAIMDNGLLKQFIGGHPMAGGEKTGYENANPLILENAYYILTPTNEVSEEKVKRYEALISSIGALVLVLDYKLHDYVTAAVSHLPHIIAASLVNLVKEADHEDGLMKMIAAGGFKDITRIASSSPTMWESICMTNTEHIVVLLDRYIKSLQHIQNNLLKKEAKEIYNLFESAKAYRDSFVNTSSGPIKKAFTVHVDIPDQPGTLAKTASLLATQDISIKNIGIMHQREYINGALRIEFYDETNLQKAICVLKNNNYSIYE